MKNYAYLVFMMTCALQPLHGKFPILSRYQIEQMLAHAQQDPTTNALAQHLDAIHKNPTYTGRYVLPQDIDSAAIIHATLLALRENRYPTIAPEAIDIMFPDLSKRMLITDLSVICMENNHLNTLYHAQIPIHATHEKCILINYEAALSNTRLLLAWQGARPVIAYIEKYLRIAQPAPIQNNTNGSS